MFLKNIKAEVIWKSKLAPKIWLFLTAASIISIFFRNEISYNNFLIFKGVFWHTWHQQSLYSFYPSEYFDQNHYGPLFSLMIAPFAIGPTFISAFFWSMVMTMTLLYAIQKLDLDQTSKNIILLIGIQELVVTTLSQQTNPFIAASIILSFLLIKKGKEQWAAAIIMFGFMIKIYGIAGGAFIIFSKRPFKLITYCLLWGTIFFIAPMLISSPSYILNAYKEWYEILVVKHNSNVNLSGAERMQDISFMGFFRRALNMNIPNIFFLVPAAILTYLPGLRNSQFKNERFQYSYLAMILLAVVMFSSSSESPTYIIAVTGVAIWYVVNEKSNTLHGKILLIFMLLLTCFSYTDLFPASIRNVYVIPYSLKALPCMVIWAWIVWELMTKDFTSKREDQPL